MTDLLAPAPELVPGYGWVVWRSCRLDESAHRFVQLHQPEPDTSWDGGRSCLYCGRRWPCAEVRWAAGRLNLPATAQPASRRRSSSPGRHRLDPHRPFSLRRVVVAVMLLVCLVILVVP